MSGKVSDLVAQLEEAFQAERHKRQIEETGRRSLQKKLQSAMAVIKEIANDGCGVGYGGETCTDLSDNHSDWCWCCIAREGMERINELP